jgi:predicted lipid-binding transport protein (Tim44 family)
MQRPSAFHFFKPAQRRAAPTAWALLPLTAALMLAMHPLAALARAGGGQHFGGGVSYGGHGGGLFSFWPLLLLGHGSGFGFLIFLLVVYYLYQQSQSRRVSQWPGAGSWSPTLDAGAGSDESSTLGTGVRTAAFDPQAVAQGLGAIKAHDPNFDEHAFMDRAETVFFKVQQAWAARNQDLARDVMSAALYERHKMQTDQLIANHQIDVLENIVIGHARIVDAAAATPYDSIVVSFDAAMADYTIDERSKKVVDGDANQRQFTERWSFIRRADAKTAAGQTQLASSCPSCGAPLSLENGKCAYCGAFVRSTSSDWVVDSIEQS